MTELPSTLVAFANHHRALFVFFLKKTQAHIRVGVPVLVKGNTGCCLVLACKWQQIYADTRDDDADSRRETH